MFPSAGDEPQGKVNQAVENIHQIWQATWKERATQLVFCDLSTPKDKGFSVYRDMAGEAAKLGRPEQEIAFIQDYDLMPRNWRCFATCVGQSPHPVRQHAENGFRHERAGAD